MQKLITTHYQKTIKNNICVLNTHQLLWFPQFIKRANVTQLKYIFLGV